MNYRAQLPLTIDGVKNPFIDAAIKKLEKYKIPHVITGIELEGREFISIQQVDGAFVKRAKSPAKAKPSTGINSTELADGRHVHTHPSGLQTICSFPWEEARHWKIAKATRARVDKDMRTAHALPLKGEIHINQEVN